MEQSTSLLSLGQRCVGSWPTTRAWCLSLPQWHMGWDTGSLAQVADIRKCQVAISLDAWVIPPDRPRADTPPPLTIPTGDDRAKTLLRSWNRSFCRKGKRI